VPFLPDLIVRSQRVVTRDATRPASIHIRGGKIVGVLDFSDWPAGCPLDEGGNAVVMPGVVDTHVHVNEPGCTEGEGFAAATRAAAAGGITTLMDMSPNSIPMTTTLEAVRAKQDAADGKCHVDVGLWGGVVPGNERELAPMLAAGVFGFTCCLGSSGAAGLPIVSEADLRVAMPAIAGLGVPLLVHAELQGPIDAALSRQPARRGLLTRLLTGGRSRRRYGSYLASRPKDAETEAIALIIALCREFQTRIHILHLSSSDALTPLYHARSARLPITAETCPHYLSFVAEEIADGATAFKCAPPIRERENREFLWAALAGGLIQMVVSGHSPAPTGRVRQSDDFGRAWAGISSLQLSLSATWTGATARGYSLNQVADWMCRMPARIAGLDRKGVIEPGYDADLVVFDPDAEFIVDTSILHGNYTRTPYVGRRLRGVIERTYLRGRRIYERGKAIGSPYGRMLVRTPGHSSGCDVR
jgi:allantoinase